MSTVHFLMCFFSFRGSKSWLITYFVVLVFCIWNLLTSWLFCSFVRKWLWRNMKKCWKREKRPSKHSRLKRERWTLKSLNPCRPYQARKLIMTYSLNWSVCWTQKVEYSKSVGPFCISNLNNLYLRINVRNGKQQIHILAKLMSNKGNAWSRNC